MVYFTLYIVTTLAALGWVLNLDKKTNDTDEPWSNLHLISWLQCFFLRFPYDITNLKIINWFLVFYRFYKSKNSP